MVSTINFLFFDLFGVLLGIDKSTIIHYVAQTAGVPYRIAKEEVLGENFMCLERGEIDFSKYFQGIQYAMPGGSVLDYGVFKSKWVSNEIAALPASQFLKTLRENYNIFIISNTTIEHVERLKKTFSFFKHIDGVITSQVAGFHKPHHKIFKFALLKSGASVETSIFVDDSIVNVSAAEQLGFTVHHYSDFGDFETFIAPYL